MASRGGLNLEPSTDTDLTEAARTALRARGLRRVFAAAAYRDFRYLWLAQMTNSAAMWVQMVGLPLLVLEVTDGSALHLGLVMAARATPAFGLGLFAGASADMWDRRSVLLATRVSVSALAIGFAALLVGGWADLWHIYLFALLRGVTQVFDQPARRAMIPSMVPPEAVANAMALNSGSVQAMRIAGAAGGGLLIALVNIESGFVLTAALYLGGIPLLLLIRTPGHERLGYRGARLLLAEMREGLSFAWRTPQVRGALVVAAVYFSLGASFIQVFIPLIARGPLGVSGAGLGVLYALVGVGGVASALLIGYLAPARRRGPILLAALGVMGLLMALFSAAAGLPFVYAAFALGLLLGGVQSLFLPLLTTLLAEAAPEGMRGRVMALIAYDQALVTVGAALAGLSAAMLGARVALLFFAGACVAASLLLSASAVRRVD